MKLLTKAIMNNMPTGSATAELDNRKSPIALKLFNPCGAQTWYIVAADAYMADGSCKALKDVKNPDNKAEVEDIIFHSYVTGMGTDEWGTVSYNEVKALRLPFGLTIERDMHFDSKNTLHNMGLVV